MPGRPRQLRDLSQFLAIPKTARVIVVTMQRDLAHSPLRPRKSAAGAAFGHLQVQAHAFPIDEDGPGINQLLSGAVIALVAMQRFEGEKELDCLGVRARAGFGGEMKGAAESHSIELGVILEVPEDGANQVRDMVVESQRGEPVARRRRSFRQGCVERKFEIDAVAERNKAGRGVRNEMCLGIKLLHHAVKYGLERGLHRGVYLDQTSLH